MKKINLISRLLSYSHEKQSPQRFARYAAMLIMLLTLGVGQMWAATIPAGTIVYVDVTNFSGTSYDEGYYMSVTSSGNSTYSATKDNTSGAGSYSPKGDGQWQALTKISGNLYAGTVSTASSTGKLSFWSKNESSYSNVWQANVSLARSWNSTNRKFTFGSGSTWHSDRQSSCFNSSTSSISLFTGDQVLYLLVNSNWKSDNAWFTACFLGVTGQTWVKCTQVGTSDYYSVTVPSGEWPYVIFCRMKSSDTSTKAWSNVWNQTDDLAPSSGKNGVEITGWSNSSNWITVYTGISVSRTPTAAANAPTISNSQTVVKSGSSVTINAQTEKTGYHWVNWTKTSGTLGNANNKSTTFTPSANSASAVANYAANTYTVAYNANDAQYPGAAAATGSTSSSSHTYGTAKALTSNGFSRAGYTFAGWNTKADGSGTSYTNGQSVTNLTSTQGATVTLYAKWTENKSTVTLTASPSGKGTFQVGGVTVTSTQAGVTTTPEVTAVPSPGYSFSGWSITGGATISSTTDNPTTVTGAGAGAAATLTATFVEDLTYYDVTFGVGTSYTSLGSLSAKVTSTSAAITSGDDLLSGTGVTFTASPNTGYTVEGWYTDAACTAGKHNAGSTTYTIASLSSDVTVYVKFVEKTWSVAFAAGTGGTVTTPDATPQTVGQISGISIAATPATGYTFNSWSSSNGGSFTEGTSTNSNTFKPTAETTVTASFNETMSSLSTSCHYDAGNPSYAAPTVSNSATTIGYGTTRTITATAAGTGYTFAGWTLTNCTRTDGGSPTATSITIRSNGDGADVSVVANYNEVLTSTWYVEGDASGPFLGWKADATTMLQKKTGYSTSNDVYWTATVTAGQVSPLDTQWEFKIYNSAGANETAKWYGWGTDDKYYWLTSENKSLTLSNSTNNVRFKPYLAGDYEFHFNTSTKVLTVTWPVFNQVRISAASPSDAGNVGDYDLSDPVENVRSVKRTLKANTTYTFKIVYESDWYGYNSGTFTRNSSTSSNSRTIVKGGGDMKLTTDYAGDYTFRFNQSTKALSIDFPEAYKVTYGKGAVDGSSGNSCSAKDIDNGNASVTSNSTWVKKDHRVEMTAPTEDGGYTFDGWFDNNSGTGVDITTEKNCTITVSSEETYYACYHENLTAVTITTDGHGTITTPDPNKSPYNLGVATTQDINATANEGYHWNTWTVSGNAALVSSVTTQSNTVKGNGTEGGTGTVTATFTPNTYTIHFNGNGSTSGEMTDQTGVTYDAATTITANAFGKTGYNFAGWATNQERANAGNVDRTDGAAHGNLASTQGATAQLWAVWTPKQSAITFDYQTSVTGYSSSGNITNATGLEGTYGADMTALTGTMPSAIEGYAFTGFYDATSDGTKYYNADGTSAHAWDKDTESGTTLYARWECAAITNIAFSPGTVVENNSTVTVTATVSPTPTGTTTICWRVLHNDTGNPLDPQPKFTPATAQGNSVSFTSPNESGMYKVEAKLHTGSSCGGGTLLDTEVASFHVAGSHTVTVAYKYSSTTIEASTSVTGRPLAWSDPITAPSIFGYTFDHWTAGDGITLSENGTSDLGDDESDKETIYIKATYNGTLTANYTPKNIVYFKDNLGWTDPEDENAHIYVNLLQSDYWNNDRGSGNQDRPNRNLTMDRVPGTTDIFYYEYNDKTTSNYISFTKESMGNSGDFYQDAPNFAHVVFPSRSLDDLGTDKATGLGFYAATPMFVPLATQTPVKKNSGRAAYYNDGYWTKYLPGTGYSLDIYQSDGKTRVKIVEFTSADELMPMKVTTDLEGGHTYKFQLKRDGDVYYGNGGTMTYNDHGQNTAWEFNNSPFSMCTIETNAAGNYTFNLSFSPNSGGTSNRLRISVDYPVASGDYRLVYTDDVHTKIHPSAIVPKENNGTSIVSFFVRHDQNPKLYIQQATVDPSTGAITWNEYPNSGTPTNQITGAIATAITKDSVWNFNLSMNGSGALSIASVEGYTGNYYIRTDAANSKWDNYRTDPDHLMTYSDYLKTDVGYTHYYTHWVNKDETGRKNVKFVIANDYSPCISDTLARETASGEWANIGSWMEEGGDLKRSANVRYMWDMKTNNIARAYIDGAQEDVSEFLLLLSSDSKIKQGETTKSSVTFSDNGNWIYEANIKAKPNAQIKLKSTWGTGGTAIEQYFKGASDKTETLVGGSGDTWYDFRLIYDFKTNRLMASYVPATGTISTNVEINADVMFIREHQGDIAQLTFTAGTGKISKIETAYGVMRFNKWTINNKDKSTHDPLVPELSPYVRDLFYISFPFRVSLEEVFGFGTYGTHWIIEEYDGAGRAEKGFWADSPTFWKFITNRKGKFLEPNTGYLLALDLDELGESSSVWANTDQVELYFPSYGKMGNITNSTVTHELEAHTCNIGPRFEGGDDRRIKDSHWNVMSVPTYINTTNVTFANTTWITEGDGRLGPNFLYEWNSASNTLTARSGVGYTYHAMHAYMVQYCGNVTWSTSVTPAAAPNRNPDAPQDTEYRLELRQNDQMVDQAFVRLSDDEHVTTGFDFNYDLSKEFNKNKANIYTMVTTLMEDGPSITETAGNCLPMTEQTTVVPVGVIAKTTGDYTFALPEGTNGVGVTLIDNETGVRTSLSALDYTVNLTAGTYNERFVLEISPIHHMPTGIEEVSGERLEVSGARKLMIDGVLYIVKDGKMFDARGARVQ